jgi:hypothetical protein
MISIIDATELQYVLRPTVYRPFGRQDDRQTEPRWVADDSSVERQRAADVDRLPGAEPMIR